MRLQATYDLKMAEQDKKIMARVVRIIPLEQIEGLRA
jgi:plasmid maintenance system antidote protein VapI